MRTYKNRKTRSSYDGVGAESWTDEDLTTHIHPDGGDIRSFDKETKEKALQSIINEGIPYKEAAKRLGISVNFLYNWNRQLGFIVPVQRHPDRAADASLLQGSLIGDVNPHSEPITKPSPNTEVMSLAALQHMVEIQAAEIAQLQEGKKRRQLLDQITANNAALAALKEDQ
jgi:hypothetical protein